jgi:hypothetical protein
LIIEKALAKICESYYSLININISDFFIVLTGCPTFYLNIEDQLKAEGTEGCLKKIKQLVVDKKYIVVAMSKSLDIDLQNDNASEIDDDMMTVPNFGYTILDIKNKYKDNLIILRKVWYDQKKEEKIKKYEETLEKANPLLKGDINEGTLIMSILFFLNF